MKVVIIFLLCLEILFSDNFFLEKAKVGKCYERLFISAKFIEKKEKIEIQKEMEDFDVKNPKFKVEKKSFKILPSYEDIKSIDAKFETKKEDIVIQRPTIYYTISKTSTIPLSDEYVKFVKKRGGDVNSLKVGECLYEYATFKDVNLTKEYISKQAYEIIDVAPPKFKSVKKRVLVRPAFKKIIKTPPVFETKVVKILIKPSMKYFKDNGKKVCVFEKKPLFKSVTKKILIKPAYTKVIKFPPLYKDIEMKVLVSKPVVTRRVIPPKKGNIQLSQKVVDKFFWSKEMDGGAKKTGLVVCKKESKEIKKSVSVEKVVTPATTKKIKIKAKEIELKLKSRLSDASVKKVKIPPQYEEIKTFVKLSDPKVIYREINCTKR